MPDRPSGGTVAVARRELARIFSRPLYAMLMVALPLSGAAVLVAIFASGVPRDLPVVVVDADSSPLSRRLVRMIDATPSIAVAFRVPDMSEARSIVLSNRAYAVVYVPAGLESDVRRGRAPRVSAYLNTQYLLPASVIRRDLRRAVGTLSAGVELRRRRLGGASGPEALARLEPVKVDAHTAFNPELNYAAFLLPALIPTLMQIFVLMTVVYAAGSELRDGTAAEWIATGGDSAARAMLGKGAPHALHFFILTACLEFLVLGVFCPGMSGKRVVIAVATALFVVAYAALAFAIVGVTANLRFGLSAGAFFGGPAFAFTGVTFPMFAMPAAGRAWGAMLPLTHYVRVVFDQAMRGAPVRTSLSGALSLACLTAVFMVVGWLRLRTVCRHDRYWGRV